MNEEPDHNSHIAPFGRQGPVMTASWRNLWDQDELTVTPVRVSLGLPKFWPETARFHFIADLAPRGWMMQLEGDEFERAYTGQLNKIGVDPIRTQIEACQTDRRRPVALACFEDIDVGQVCHRRIWAVWWLEQTGEKVGEWRPGQPGDPFDRRGER